MGILPVAAFGSGHTFFTQRLYQTLNLQVNKALDTQRCTKKERRKERKKKRPTPAKRPRGNGHQVQARDPGSSTASAQCQVHDNGHALTGCIPHAHGPDPQDLGAGKDAHCAVKKKSWRPDGMIVCMSPEMIRPEMIEQLCHLSSAP
eukprot:1156326-Pelagomonas_calceolata.AAC.3